MRTWSEPPGRDDLLRLAVIGEHLAVERLACRAAVRVAQRLSCELARGGSHDRAPAVMDGDVERKIGGVPSRWLSIGLGDAGVSTSRSMRRACPIQGSGRIAFTQSAKEGMKPRSSMTCCSPIQRVGITRPDDSVMVGPKIVSAMKMPSA